MVESCIVYERGEAPVLDTVLDESVGWAVVIGFGLFFTCFSVGLTKFEERVMGTTMSSEMFNTAGRSIGAGLTAAVIVSQWTWAATLLMSSNMGWRVGVSGPFWYASGATIQILLFAVLAIQVKRRASHMHTFMEIVKARFGTVTHCIMIVFALMANMIVTAMLLLGGAATIEDLTGMSKIWAAFLIPLLSCWIYTMHGVLKATFFASYVHTTVIFLMLIIFTFSVYAGAGDDSGLYGSPSKVFSALEKASLHAVNTATSDESSFQNIADDSRFPDLGTFIENAGKCYTEVDGAISRTDKSCSFTKRGLSDYCCSGNSSVDWGEALNGEKYCRTSLFEGRDCIDIDTTEHWESDCDSGDFCAPSFTTMSSPSGLLFGITNIVGNFGTVFVDQSYWQSAVAAKPKSAVLGFLIGGMVWFAVPFCMATTSGLVGRALTTHPELSALYITAEISGSGLTPARVLSHILGSGGAFILLLQLFMAITSTGSAEIIAVSSILTYDIYYEYINPELKTRREHLRTIFFSSAKGVEEGGYVAIGSINALMQSLVSNNFFEKPVEAHERSALASAVIAFEVENRISTQDLYSAVNRAVCSNSLEGVILLRVSKFFTAVFAVFMGFLAVFLQTLGFDLGWVYMSMGVIIGSAVGPASLTILMETANAVGISAGAIGGLVLGLMGWSIKAAVDNDGEVSYDTLGQDWPWVVGNLCAILGGLFISLTISLVMPDKSFKWSMLNERIPLVDDIEPPKDSDESDEKLQRQVKIAVVSSVILTVILLVVWPLPLHFSGVVFDEGGFTFWVILEMLWAIVGGIVIIYLPLYESIREFFKSTKLRDVGSQDDKSCELPNGAGTLVIQTSSPDVGEA